MVAGTIAAKTILLLVKHLAHGSTARCCNALLAGFTPFWPCFLVLVCLAVTAALARISSHTCAR